MARKAETVFKERIKPQIDALPNTWCVKIQQVVIRGTPDFLICCNSHFIAIELKAREKDKASELQEYTLKKISKAGGIAMIVYPENWDAAYEFLHTLATKGYDAIKDKTFQ